MLKVNNDAFLRLHNAIFSAMNPMKHPWPSKKEAGLVAMINHTEVKFMWEFRRQLFALDYI